MSDIRASHVIADLMTERNTWQARALAAEAARDEAIEGECARAVERDAARAEVAALQAALGRLREAAMAVLALPMERAAAVIHARQEMGAALAATPADLGRKAIEEACRVARERGER